MVAIIVAEQDNKMNSKIPFRKSLTSLVEATEHIVQFTGLILGLHPANERRRYEVTPSLVGWAQT